MIYFFIALLLLYFSYHYDISRNRNGKKFCYRLAYVILVCLAGLRYRIGIDSTQYVYSFFHETRPFIETLKELEVTQYPLWKLLNSIVYTLGGKFFMVQFIQSAFVNLLVFSYIKKHSRYIFVCVFLYFIWMYPGYNFEEMKQTFAVAISLYANDYILEKKYVKGIGLFVVACLFHFAAILVALLAFLTFLKFDIRGIAIMVAAFVIAGIIDKLYGDYLMYLDFDEFLQGKVAGYIESDKFGVVEGRNINFFVVRFTPILFPLAAFLYSKKYGRNQELLKLEPYFILGLLFMVLQTRISILYRYANFYAIYLILFLSQAFVDVIKNERTTVSVTFKAFIPAIFFTLYVWTTYVGITGKSDRYNKFYPYASIIDMSTDREREKVFAAHAINKIMPPPRHYEY